jgi:hypothetical protein
MHVDSEQPPMRRHPLTVERQFKGSVFDVADARRFARMTASWWGVDPEPVENVVDELSRRAVCSRHPGFGVFLTLDGDDVRVRLEEREAEPRGQDGPRGPVPDASLRRRPGRRR